MLSTKCLLLILLLGTYEPISKMNYLQRISPLEYCFPSFKGPGTRRRQLAQGHRDFITSSNCFQGDLVMARGFKHRVVHSVNRRLIRHITSWISSTISVPKFTTPPPRIITIPFPEEEHLNCLNGSSSTAFEAIPPGFSPFASNGHSLYQKIVLPELYENHF